MVSRPLRRRGAVNGPVLGLLAGIVLAIIGLVFLVQGIRAADQGYPAYAFGISVDNAVPGVILLVIAAVVAIWAIVTASLLVW